MKLLLYHETEPSNTHCDVIEKDLEIIKKQSYKKARTSQDWAQPRPEWGLARNASLIIGPRSITEGINLNARSFLHSYDYTQDQDGSLLAAIIGGPIVVAQWINAQYLFSTLDNTAFGGGSKVTANISGKVGCMQGNASDLMHGLSLQSVYETDSKAYHELVRLTVVIYAPKSFARPLIEKNEKVSELIRNKWIHIIYKEIGA